MKRVTGIGGIFFKAKDAPALQAWYKRHLGITPHLTISSFDASHGTPDPNRAPHPARDPARHEDRPNAGRRAEPGAPLDRSDVSRRTPSPRLAKEQRRDAGIYEGNERNDK